MCDSARDAYRVRFVNVDLVALRAWNIEMADPPRPGDDDRPIGARQEDISWHGYGPGAPCTVARAYRSAYDCWQELEGTLVSVVLL